MNSFEMIQLPDISQMTDEEIAEYSQKLWETWSQKMAPGFDVGTAKVAHGAHRFPYASKRVERVHSVGAPGPGRYAADHEQNQSK